MQPSAGHHLHRYACRPAVPRGAAENSAPPLSPGQNVACCPRISRVSTRHRPGRLPRPVALRTICGSSCRKVLPPGAAGHGFAGDEASAHAAAWDQARLVTSPPPASSRRASVTCCYGIRQQRAGKISWKTFLEGSVAPVRPARIFLPGGSEVAAAVGKIMSAINTANRRLALSPARCCDGSLYIDGLCGGGSRTWM